MLPAWSYTSNKKVYSLARLKNYDKITRNAVKDYLSSNANGKFLWVVLVCENLERILSMKTHKMLKAIPPGLDLFTRE